MTEDGLERFLDEFRVPGRATFFCHEAFPCLAATRHELCPHPFISNLDDWRPRLEGLRRRVNPTARGTRPHSCVFSHLIGLGLHQMGFEYVSQAGNLYQDGLVPFRHPWGVWELPIYYMDNMDFWATANWPDLEHEPFARAWIDRAVNGPSLYVFDFHPVHVALNTRTALDYQSVKARIVDHGISPFDLSFPGRGTRHYFQALLDAMIAAGESSASCSEAVEIWSNRSLER